jgi:hypothetical protein
MKSGRIGTALVFLAALPIAPPMAAQQAADPAAVNPAPASPAGPAPVTPANPKAEVPVPGQPGEVQDKRVFGVLPNYRTADGTLPFHPITTRQKFNIAVKDTFDYPSYLLAGAFAGISQLDDSNPSFGQGVKGYAKRYGASVADQDLGNFMTEAFMPTLLHQDPRYFRKVTGSFRSRLLYAATRVAVVKTDNGNWTFNASEFLGNGIVASLGNAYYPDSVGFSPTMQRMFTQIGTDALSQVLKEFWPDIKRKWFKKRDGNVPVQPGE